MTLTVTAQDEKWMRQGVIKELIETYGFMKDEAIQIFEKSSLLKMLHRDPEYAFHYDTEYWAKQVVERLKRRNLNLPSPRMV
jgi:hypothetical protein